MSPSKDSLWRPNAFRSTAISISPRSFGSVFDTWASPSFARRMHPAQVPRIGIPSPARRTMSSNSPNFTRSFEIVVLSPPGIVKASTFARSGGRRTVIASPVSPASAMARFTASTCSLTSPWTPMTPTRTSSRTREVPIRVRGSRGAPAVSLAEKGLEDLRELLRILRETLRCDPVHQHRVSGLQGRERSPDDLVPLGEDRLAVGGSGERLWPSVFQGHDFERVIEEKRPHVPLAQETDSYAIDVRVEFRVRLQRLTTNSNLIEREFVRVSTERGHVPVAQGLEGEGRGHE